MTRPRASVVVASSNKRPYLIRTLGCLQRQRRAADDILVVDDASDPGLGELGTGVTVLRRDGPPHLQAARNAGVQAATGEAVILIDDDCLVREDWLEHHLWHHEPRSCCLVVGAVRRIRPDGRERFWEAPTAEGVDEHRQFERWLDLLKLNVPPWNLAPCSNNASVSRDLLLGVDGYDENMTGWGVDDIDLCYRLVRSGVPLIMDGSLVTYHQEHPRDLERQAREEAHNLRVFAQRHGFWAYGEPPEDWRGPVRYAPEGEWYRAESVLDGTAIRVTRVERPGPETPRRAWPLDWVVGTGMSRAG